MEQNVRPMEFRKCYNYSKCLFVHTRVTVIVKVQIVTFLRYVDNNRTTLALNSNYVELYKIKVTYPDDYVKITEDIAHASVPALPHLSLICNRIV